MDFLDPKKKRSHKIRLYLGYGLMAIALTIATVVLVFAAYGFDIDRNTGNIIQNGLVIVDAHPESARILVNGEDKGGTDSRLVLPAAKYTIELRRDGYLPWKHDINLEGSSIEQLVYPFLYPEKLINKELQSYNGVPPMASESPDRKWLVVSVPDAVGTFQVVELGDKKHPTVTINIPTDALTAAAGAHSFEAVEWSTDNTHLLLKHVFATGSEFIMLDRANPANSLNLNKVFATRAFTSISLRDKKPDQFYLLNAPDGKLYTADSKARSTSLVREGVHTYKSYEADRLVYTVQPEGKATAEVRLRDKAEDYLLRLVPKNEVYLLDMASFNGHFYVVAGSKADNRAYVYKDPFDDLSRKSPRTPQPFRVLITPGAEYVSFSAIARFIAVQGGSSFAVYDAETDRQYRFDTKLALQPKQKATWMDGHRLLLISQNSVQAFDFDGTNMHKLSTSLPNYKPFFDRDYTALFTLAPSATDPARTSLIRTDMKIVPLGSDN